jgi:hypothetical protein
MVNARAPEATRQHQVCASQFYQTHRPKPRPRSAVPVRSSCSVRPWIPQGHSGPANANHSIFCQNRKHISTLVRGSFVGHAYLEKGRSRRCHEHHGDVSGVDDLGDATRRGCSKMLLKIQAMFVLQYQMPQLSGGPSELFQGNQRGQKGDYRSASARQALEGTILGSETGLARREPEGRGRGGDGSMDPWRCQSRVRRECDHE